MDFVVAPLVTQIIPGRMAWPLVALLLGGCGAGDAGNTAEEAHFKDTGAAQGFEIVEGSFVWLTGNQARHINRVEGTRKTARLNPVVCAEQARLVRRPEAERRGKQIG